MKILAIPATNSRDGLNAQLLRYAATVLQEDLPDVEVEFVDMNDYEIPLFSVERSQAGIPELATSLYDKIGSVDAVMISFAEYNGSYTPVWKNIFDWMSRIDQQVFQGKPVAMFAASPGGRGGASVLATATSTGPYLGAELVGSLGIPTFGETFDSEAGRLVDADLDAQFRKVLGQLW